MRSLHNIAMKQTVQGSFVSNYRTTSSARVPSPLSSSREGAGTGVLLTLGGGIALGGLFSLSHYVKLDNLLLVSKAIYNVISGVNNIGIGIGKLLLGLAQMIGIASLAVIAVVSILAVSSGLIRLCIKLLPQFSSTWNFLAHFFNGLVRLISMPYTSSQRRTAASKVSRHHSESPAPKFNNIPTGRAA